MLHFISAYTVCQGKKDLQTKDYIFLNYNLTFFPTFRIITVGGFVNQLIKKFWPYYDVLKILQ